MNHKQSQSPFIEQRLFVRSSKLETMRAAPIRICAKGPAGETRSGHHAPLVSLIDFSLLNEIFENFLDVTGLPIAVIDLDGRVLASSKWQRLCIEFHRVHPTTREGCLISDTVLSQQVEADTDYAFYQCANGLIDCATPIMVDGMHVANLFTGQFLRAAPDQDFFLRQQVACGFEKGPYFKALSEIPIVTADRIPAILKLLKGLAQQIARQSLAEQRALSALAEVEQRVVERTREVSEREQHFRTLFEGAPVGQVLIDPATLLILECNQAAVDTYGYTVEELQAKRISDLEVAYDGEDVQAICREIETRGTLRFETRVRRKNGELRDLFVTAVLLPGAHGNRYLATHLDVTEQKQAEHSRERTGRALRLLTDCNNLLLHADDEQHLLNHVCQLVVEAGGYLMAWVGLAEHDEKKSVRPVAHAGYEVGYLESIRISWADTEFGQGPTGESIRTGVTQVNQDYLANPRMLPWREAALKRGYRASISLPLTSDRGVFGVLAIYAREADAFVAEEVALLEKLAANLAFGMVSLRARIRLAQTNEELQGFTYAASHDLKGPLGRLAAFSSLLKQKYRDRLEGDGVQFIDFIEQNATRLTALVDALLLHSQVEHQPGTFQAVDLQAATTAVFTEYAEDIRRCGAEVRIDVPSAWVLVAPQSLAQVLRNVLTNALKYSAQARPPLIQVGGVPAGNHFRLWIRDNGIGFDMAYHDRIFEIFRRLHTYSEYPGNGVGLALVKKAMDSMGGSVWAESNPGEGATFFLEFQTADRLTASLAELPPDPP